MMLQMGVGKHSTVSFFAVLILIGPGQTRSWFCARISHRA
jgi:hypothetical protein